jgi:hypothetical protein
MFRRAARGKQSPMGANERDVDMLDKRTQAVRSLLMRPGRRTSARDTRLSGML